MINSRQQQQLETLINLQSQTNLLLERLLAESEQTNELITIACDAPNPGKVVEMRDDCIRRGLNGEVCSATDSAAIIDAHFDFINATSKNHETKHRNITRLCLANTLKKAGFSLLEAKALSNYFRPFYQANPSYQPAWYVA